MNCDAVIKSIPFYFYGEVAPDAEDAIEEHLGICPACRDECSAAWKIRPIVFEGSFFRPTSRGVRSESGVTVRR